jgi:outer membrane scaffolding protein for murein synthesis (MipA/OmpV family)
LGLALVAGAAPAWAAAPAGAEPADEAAAAPLAAASAPSRSAPRWVLGATLASAPSYAGADDRKLGLRPVVAARVGRWMVSTSSARRLGGGSDLAGGVSTTVLDEDRWQLGVGFRLTHGRSSSDHPLLAGLPDVRSSVAFRASARWQLNRHAQLSFGWQQDLLRQQGMRLTMGLGGSWPLSPTWVLDAGVGTQWASARAMRVHHGVEPAAATSTRSAWQPGAGLEQAWVGVGLSHEWSKNWRVSVGVGHGVLLGAAADSPLTRQRHATTAQVSVAYVAW